MKRASRPTSADVKSTIPTSNGNHDTRASLARLGNFLVAEYLHQSGTIKFTFDSPCFNLGRLCKAAEIKMTSGRTYPCGEKTRYLVGMSHCNGQANIRAAVRIYLSRPALDKILATK